MEGMMAQDTTTKGETSAFRAAEKAYKRDGKRPYLGLSEQQLNGLLDFEECAPPLPNAALAFESCAPKCALPFASLSASRSPRCSPLIEAVPVDASAPDWLRNAKIWSVRGVDGFRFVSCPFAAEAQLRLVSSALSEWIEPPSANNLATAAGVSPDASRERLWLQHTESPTNSLLSRLTWATLGYQYQWTPRCYDERCRSPFPRELARLAADVGRACGWALRPEAAILNLYSSSSTMGGHRDDAEPCQEAPIVSMSLGLECVYLLGGPTKDSAPLAMRLRSGDMVVQGGHSRGYVHGVPRVLDGTLPAELAPDGAAAAQCVELQPFSRWLGEHRLNINVRQVFAA